MRNQRAVIAATSLTAACGLLVAVAVFGADDPEPETPHAIVVSPTRTRPASPSSPVQPGWQVIDDPHAGLRYEVPPDWSPAPDTETLEASNGAVLGHLVDYGTYLCQGAEYGRAFTGTGRVDGDPAKVATELAAAIAADQYSDGSQTAKVTLSRPTPVVRDGSRGTLIRAEATATDTDTDPCASDRGTITVIALATPAGTSVMVTGADTDDHNATNAPLAPAETLRAVTDSVRPRG
ncbi:hypothetical protein [Actinokineospora enzanensis]|uniref:hypothetical protein n=1 Tax=Actinokineospora enzanensis TaxID=155975 RepID=UPI0012EC9CAC|nr:hypothetical protein [Actinokineospora enzanensis]